MFYILKSIDTAAFYFINHTLENYFFDRFMPNITKFGNSFYLFLLGAILLFLDKRKIRSAGLVLLSGISVNHYVVLFLKHSIARPRPYEVLSDVNVLISSSGFSFPSGHATTAFIAATILSAYFKRYFLFYGIAALVAISRVYLGVHYPSDVGCGAVLGIFVGYGLIWISKKLELIQNESSYTKGKISSGEC